MFQDGEHMGNWSVVGGGQSRAGKAGSGDPGGNGLLEPLCVSPQGQ